VIRRAPAILFGLGGLLTLYLIAPFVAGLQQIAVANWRNVDWTTLAHATAISVGSASLATALIALGGIPLGYILARSRFRGVGVLGFLVQLPLALPPLTSGVLLLFLFGAYAPLARLLGSVTDTFGGIVLAETFVAAPFLVIAARSGFAAVDPVLEDVAATLGHPPLARFAKVSLRLAWPAIRAGLLLAWLRAFGEFGATVMVAYHPYSLPVYTYVAFGAQGLPAMLPVLLPTLAAAIGIMALSAHRPRALARHRRFWATDLPAPSLTAADAEQDGAVDFAFSIAKRLGPFVLSAEWAPSARRLAILGPSGSGKSLTLRLIAGLDAPEAGHVRLGRRDLTRMPPEQRGIAYVPQNYGLLPDRTVLQQLLFPVGARPEAARAWIARLGLAGLADRRPAELSLGQQQRVALARALMRPAGLLLLDEPFSALDTPLRRQLREELGVLQARIGIRTVLVTHDPEEAMRLADEVLVLQEGRVLQTGRIADVFIRPASRVVASLLGVDEAGSAIAMDPFHLAIGDGVRLAVDGPRLHPGMRVGWGLRREFARLDPDGAYAGEVEQARPFGAGFELTVRFGDARLRILSDRTAAHLGPCRLDIAASAVQVWPVEDVSFPNSSRNLTEVRAKHLSMI
jgi:molybdate transport system permease protein